MVRFDEGCVVYTCLMIFDEPVPTHILCYTNRQVYGNIASSQGGGIHGDQWCVLLQLINSKVTKRVWLGSWVVVVC